MASYEIKQDFVAGLPQIPFEGGKPSLVIGHSTDDKGATAQNIRDYEATHFNDAFVHYAVDWSEIVQIAPIEHICWGCGPNGNPLGIQVELCETDDPAQFQEAYLRYIWLLAKLLHDAGLPISAFKTHQMITQELGGTDHTDPVEYLASHGVSIPKLINDIEYILNTMNGTTDAQPIFHQVLHMGMSNDDVKTVQELLNKHGFNLVVDGAYGARTYTAVLLFQRKMGLHMDGVVGPITFSALLK